MVGVIGIMCYAFTAVIVTAAVVTAAAASYSAYDQHEKAEEAQDAQEAAQKGEKLSQKQQSNIQKAQLRKQYVRSMMAAGSQAKSSEFETKRNIAVAQVTRSELHDTRTARPIGRPVSVG